MADTPKDRAALLLAIGWSLAIASVGGPACGWCISSSLGEFGALSLVACGMLGGYVSRKITRAPSKVAGICQAIAVCFAFLVGETCWLHWETVEGEPSWSAAIRLWPLFLREYTFSALIGAGCAAYGAWSAYGYAAGSDPRRAEPASPKSPLP